MERKKSDDRRGEDTQDLSRKDGTRYEGNRISDAILNAVVIDIGITEKWEKDQKKFLEKGLLTEKEYEESLRRAEVRKKILKKAEDRGMHYALGEVDMPLYWHYLKQRG